MSTTQDEARKYLFGLLPPGIEKLYDLEPGGDFYQILDTAAYLLRVFGFNLLDALRREQFPSMVVDKLPDWERFLGIARFFLARFGSIAQRQQAVVSKIRERGPFIDSLVKAVLGPLLGYFTSTPLEILRADRNAIRVKHTYSIGLDGWSIPAGTTSSRSIKTHDGGKIAQMGVRLFLEFGLGGPFTGFVTLTGPGYEQTFPIAADGAIAVVYYAKAFAGSLMSGWWRATVQNTSAGAMPIIVSFFAEGVGTNQNTAGAVAHWGVYADPAHVGESGYSDLEAADAAVARIKHADSVGRIITSKQPWPGVTSGTHAAIPGRCIPSAAK